MMQMIRYENNAVAISAARGNPLQHPHAGRPGRPSVGVELGGFEEPHAGASASRPRRRAASRPINVRTFDNFAVAFQALRAGQVEAVTSIDAVAAEYDQRGDFPRVLHGLFATPAALAFRSRVLAQEVAKVLTEMKADGSLDDAVRPLRRRHLRGRVRGRRPAITPCTIWPWEGFFDYLFNPFLLEGALTTLWLTVGLAGLRAGCSASCVALMRLSGNRAAGGLAGAYCWMFRGTPLLVQLLIIYTGLPLFGIRFGVTGRRRCSACR